MTPDLRERMEDAARHACEAMRYRGAGTIEFLVDRDHRFYFIEMNTRLQVEHPVTELLTGIDLVHGQLRIASGLGLPREGRAELAGHAIEFRVNAEDPTRNFMPAPGTVTRFTPPLGPGVRVDTHLFDGYRVPPFYDSLVAKVIVWAEDRFGAIGRAGARSASSRSRACRPPATFTSRSSPASRSGAASTRRASSPRRDAGARTRDLPRARRGALHSSSSSSGTSPGEPLGSLFEGEVDPYAETLADGVVEQAEDLDRRISEVAVGWPADRLGAVERNVLRIALLELDRGDVPKEVVLDEAVRLSKRYSSEDAGRLVNGILGRIVREAA